MRLQISSLVFLALGVTAAQASSIQNGSFEDSILPSKNWAYSSTITGWYAASGSIEVGQAGVYGVTGQDGANVLELDSNKNSTVAQDLSLTSGAHTLTFDFAKRSGTSDETNRFDVLWNGNLVASLAPTSTNFSSASYVVNGVSGTNVLAFRAMGTNDSYGGMVDKVNVQAVPEPASIAALVVGGLGILRRRCKA